MINTRHQTVILSLSHLLHDGGTVTSTDLPVRDQVAGLQTQALQHCLHHFWSHLEDRLVVELLATESIHCQDEGLWAEG